LSQVQRSLGGAELAPPPPCPKDSEIELDQVELVHCYVVIERHDQIN